MKSFDKTMRLCLAMVLIVALGGCLPDQESVPEKKQVSLDQTQALSYADTLNSFSVSSQGTLSARFAGPNPPTPGVQGASPDNRMRYAYCQESQGANTNHMMLAWYTMHEVGSNNFAAKGLGAHSGNTIMQEMAEKSTPESLAIMKDGALTLRGPRANGATELGLADLTGCNALNIPQGAPVILVENMKAPGLTVAGSDTYEYKSEPCPDPNDTGSITYRKLVSATEWESYDKTCDGKVSTRVVTIASNNSSKLVGALDLSASGQLQGTLSTLVEKKACRDAQYDKDDEPTIDGLPYQKDHTISGLPYEKDPVFDGLYTADSKDDTDPKNFETCDEEVDVLHYEGPGDNETGDELRREELTVACGAGRIGVIPQSDPYNRMSFDTFRGPLNLYNGWTGTAVYERVQRNADGKGAGKGGHGDAAQWGPWTGKSLECDRQERLTLACSDAFPQYNDAVRYTPHTAGGIVMRRVNETRGWANKNTLTPNPDKDPSTGWALELPTCQWRQNENFNGCPGGFTQASEGRYHRNIQMLSAVDSSARENNNIRDASPGDWVSDQPLVCQFSQTTTTGCMSGERERRTTTMRVTRIFPWSVPTQSSTTTTESWSCGGSGTDPLVFDLDGDGDVSFLDMDAGVMFDMDDDGTSDLTSWVDSNDGILVMDRNGDGTINNHSEMFGSSTMGGFDHLSAYDTNNDGQIDNRDAAWSSLKVWRDANSDGISQADELHALSAFDIRNINLSHTDTHEQVGDNRILAEGTYETFTNRVMTALDVAFSFISNFSQEVFDAARESWTALFGDDRPPSGPDPNPNEEGGGGGGGGSLFDQQFSGSGSTEPDPGRK